MKWRGTKAISWQYRQQPFRALAQLHRLLAPLRPEEHQFIARASAFPAFAPLVCFCVVTPAKLFNPEKAVATTKSTKHTKGQKVVMTGLFTIRAGRVSGQRTTTLCLVLSAL